MPSLITLAWEPLFIIIHLSPAASHFATGTPALPRLRPAERHNPRGFLTPTHVEFAFMLFNLD